MLLLMNSDIRLIEENYVIPFSKVRCVHKPALTLSTLMKAWPLKLGQHLLSYLVNELVNYQKVSERTKLQ